MLRVCLKFCSFYLADIELTVYQNAHVNKGFIPFDVYFIFTVPLVTFINTKGNNCLEEFLMLLMDRNFNPFATRINMQTSSMGIYQLHYGALGFSLTQLSEPLRNTHVLGFFGDEFIRKTCILEVETMGK